MLFRFRPSRARIGFGRQCSLENVGVKSASSLVLCTFWALFFVNCHLGCGPFACLKSARVLLALRNLFVELEIPNARVYRTHDFRRGHAEDLKRCGARLYEIPAAGDWSSAAFILYLDKERLARDAVAEAYAGFSNPEPEEE
jgi:hypothetical protein